MGMGPARMRVEEVGGKGERGRVAGELGASESNKVYLIDCNTSIDLSIYQ